MTLLVVGASFAACSRSEPDFGGPIDVSLPGGRSAWTGAAKGGLPGVVEPNGGRGGAGGRSAAIGGSRAGGHGGIAAAPTIDAGTPYEGGVADAARTNGHPDAAARGADAGDPLSGSYDVVGNHQGRARLDIRWSSGAYEAILTPFFGHPQSVAVAVTSDEVVLTGPVVISEDEEGVLEDKLVWNTITVPRLPDGTLGPAPVVESEGYWPPPYDPCTVFVDELPIVVEPSLAPDESPPAFRVLRSHLATHWVVPWDPLDVRLSEGVSGAQVVQALSLEGPVGAIGGVVWTAIASPLETTWDAVVWAEGRAWDWDQVSGETVRVAATGGLSDPAGNPSGPLAWFDFDYVYIGPPATAFSFDGPTQIGREGTVTHAEAGTADAVVCESGGCMVLGISQRWDMLAGRFADTVAPTAVHVRYRLMSTSQSLPQNQSPPWRLLAETARPGQAPAIAELPIGSMTFDEASGGFPWVSDWTTGVLPVAPSAAPTEVGFRIWSDGGTECAAVQAVVVVDAVTAL